VLLVGRDLTDVEGVAQPVLLLDQRGDPGRDV